MVRISALHIDLYLCPSCKLTRFFFILNIETHHLCVTLFNDYRQ